ncbi:MAG TPA: hypothetical protein VE990_04880 [Acidimicrobiales bacterium]|nr:hypothetical protein [Acidimicrobiales bacterium]
MTSFNDPAPTPRRGRLIRSRRIRTAVGVTLAAGVLTGAAFAYAAGDASAPLATGTGPTTADLTASAGGTAGAAAGRPARAGAGGIGVIGRVASVSASGGRFGAGTITVTVPDGKTVTGDLGPKARVVAYHGPGDKPTAESLTDLRTGEVVVLRFRAGRRPRGAAGAGVNGSASSGASGSGGANARIAGGPGRAAVLAAATSTSGTQAARVVSLVIDTGFAAG